MEVVPLGRATPYKAHYLDIAILIFSLRAMDSAERLVLQQFGDYLLQRLVNHAVNTFLLGLLTC